jgi:hypothetical protein
MQLKVKLIINIIFNDLLNTQKPDFQYDSLQEIRNNQQETIRSAAIA